MFLYVFYTFFISFYMLAAVKLTFRSSKCSPLICLPSLMPVLLTTQPLFESYPAVTELSDSNSLCYPGWLRSASPPVSPCMSGSCVSASCQYDHCQSVVCFHRVARATPCHRSIVVLPHQGARATPCHWG